MSQRGEKVKKILLSIFCIVLLSGCSAKNDDKLIDKDIVTEEHLYLSDVDSAKADMSSYEGFTDVDHVFEVISLDESFRFIDEEASAVIYYGFNTCPYCIEIVPTLNNIAKDLELTVYYVDLMANPIEDDQRAKFYELYDEYTIKDEAGESTFSVPQVSVIVNGEIKSTHIGAVDLFDPANGSLNQEQVEQLSDIFETNLSELSEEVK